MKTNSNSEIIEKDQKSTKRLCNQPLFRAYENQCYMDAERKYDIKWECFELETVFKVG